MVDLTKKSKYKRFLSLFQQTDCTKRLYFNFKSSLLLKIISDVQNITTRYKHIYNLIQTNLQASKLLKQICTDTKLLKVIKSARLIKAWIKLNCPLFLGLMK